MPESYPKTPENRDSFPASRTRGISRPFPEFGYEAVRKAFESVVGSKPSPSEGECRLIEKAVRYCRFLVRLPGIERAWVCNSLSMNAGDGDSDIDLFIETLPGKLWTGRIFATLFFALLGVRRYGDKVRGRFCLSFFAVVGADFGPIAIDDDVYLFEWANRLVPVDGKRSADEVSFPGAFSGGIGIVGEANNPQAGTKRDSLLRLALRDAVEPESRSATKNAAVRSPTVGPFSRLLESVLKRLFEKRTLAEYERRGKPWGVVISDSFLKFHPDDRRIEIREAVRTKLEGASE